MHFTYATSKFEIELNSFHCLRFTGRKINDYGLLLVRSILINIRQIFCVENVNSSFPWNRNRCPRKKSCQIIKCPQFLYFFEFNLIYGFFPVCLNCVAASRRWQSTGQARIFDGTLNEYWCLPHCDVFDALMNCFVATINHERIFQQSKR